MSKIDIYKCDNCDKSAETCREDGWVHMKAGLGNQAVELSVSAGVDEYHKPHNYGLETRERWDFCSEDCLRTYITRMYDERNETA